AVRDVRTHLPGFRPFRQRLDPDLAERRISPHGFTGADAKHAGALDHQQIGFCEPYAAGEPDDEKPRAPIDTAHRVLEYLAADGIEHHVRALPVGDTLDDVTERLASIAYEVIGASPHRNLKLVVARSGADDRTPH